MRCPFCGVDRDRVVDSRPSADSVRRRRVCLACDRRFTTYERREQVPLRVMKRDGQRVPFRQDKILAGLARACHKRPIPSDVLEGAVVDIEAALLEGESREVSSHDIGELVLEKLRAIDDVAYVRFASVYRAFDDIGAFLDTLKPLLKQQQQEQT